MYILQKSEITFLINIAVKYTTDIITHQKRNNQNWLHSNDVYTLGLCQELKKLLHIVAAVNNLLSHKNTMHYTCY